MYGVNQLSAHLEDAFHCFMGCEMEVLTIGNQILYKETQNPALALSYKDSFELD